MRRFWFHLIVLGGVAASILAVLFSVAGGSPVAAQAPATSTPAPAGTPPIVTAQEEGANVRSGPSSTVYPVIGRLRPGDTAKAIGVSPYHEWIEIEFNGATGWVYTAFVTLSPGFLPVAEPPPTPTPLATATIDPTLAAQFSAVPTQTRLPTFTPPPPLVVPDFGNTGGASGHFPMGVTIGLVALLSAAVFGLSFFIRS
ncbi:MAG TPA: SH3 domain-containing protein [Anaerolineales bacterium]